MRGYVIKKEKVMKFEKQIQREGEFLERFLLGFIIMITLVLSVFLVWLQVQFGFFSFL